MKTIEEKSRELEAAINQVKETSRALADAVVDRDVAKLTGTDTDVVNTQITALSDKRTDEWRQVKVMVSELHAAQQREQ